MDATTALGIAHHLLAAVSPFQPWVQMPAVGATVLTQPCRRHWRVALDAQPISAGCGIEAVALCVLPLQPLSATKAYCGNEHQPSC